MTITTDHDIKFPELLAQREANTEHGEFQLGDLKFVAGKNLAVELDNDTKLLTDGSFGQLAKMLDIPAPYARRIPDDLLEYTMNYFIREKRNLNVGGLFESGRIRSFMGGGDPYLGLKSMFDTVVDEVGDDYELRYARSTDVETSFSILPAAYRESIDGSNLFGGVKVIYSDSWKMHPSVDAYIWRELCSNGMIKELESKKFRVSGSSTDDVRRQIGEFIRLSVEQLPSLLDNYNKLLTEEIDDYAQLLRRICVEYKLSGKVLDRLIFWASQPEFLITISDQRIKNMHDIVNLITFVGSHDLELSDDVRERLLAIGGNLTLNHTERCNSCGSVF